MSKDKNIMLHLRRAAIITDGIAPIAQGKQPVILRLLRHHVSKFFTDWGETWQPWVDL